ncbi:hypothetical protein [Nocardia africana]|uniref:Uncharacterized protein n=1 Tax=Nocardia africana TaxID=134964 RepID=A0ABW6NHY1_9NOCA
MGTWNALSSVVTVLSGCGVVLLAVGCFWPRVDPPRAGHIERWDGADGRPPVAWLTDWSCATPARSFTTAEAHHWMQIHRDHDCPRKRAAFAALVEAGRIHPDSTRRNTLRSEYDE